jgi:hypothetical protein
MRTELRMLIELDEAKAALKENLRQVNIKMALLKEKVAKDAQENGMLSAVKTFDGIDGKVKIDIVNHYRIPGSKSSETHQRQRVLEVIEAHQPDAEINVFRSMHGQKMKAAIAALGDDVKLNLVAEGCLACYPEPVIKIGRKTIGKVGEDEE